MSQFAQKLALWTVVILLLLIGVFLQVQSARVSSLADALAAPSNSSSAISIRRF